jgi:hypothetical protein
VPKIQNEAQTILKVRKAMGLSETIIIKMKNIIAVKGVKMITNLSK